MNKEWRLSEPITDRAGAELDLWHDHSARFSVSDSFPEIVGRSPVMKRVLAEIGKVARSDSAVLIHGESGTGKELVAKAIHRLSPRSSRRFVAINCSSIPENLLESELFGYEKGAFTGANAKKQGYFEVADRGTIFLDEVGDTHPHLQAKLLRVLQEKQFTPVGSNQVRNADVRVVAATNVDLQRAISEKQFRLDLYYRLNVLPLYLPPLRERCDDIPDLIDHFLAIANSKQEFNSHFSDCLLKIFLDYSWPGNVRELQNLVERLVIISGGGLIDASSLPSELLEGLANKKAPSLEPEKRNETETPVESLSHVKKIDSDNLHHLFGSLPESGLDLSAVILKIENDYIKQALNRTGNNKNQAAKLLGLNRTTLVEKIKKRKLAPLNAPPKEL